MSLTFSYRIRLDICPCYEALNPQSLKLFAESAIAKYMRPRDLHLMPCHRQMESTASSIMLILRISASSEGAGRLLIRDMNSPQSVYSFILAG